MLDSRLHRRVCRVLLAGLLVTFGAASTARAQDESEGGNTDEPGETAGPDESGVEMDGEEPGSDEPWYFSLPGVEWTTGPAEGALATWSEIQVPEGFDFTGRAGTRVMMEAMENPVGSGDVGTLMQRGQGWFAVFTFSENGYVSDEERDDLDADKLLESLKESNRIGNEERVRRGWAPLTLTGWHTPPHYDERSNNLEWGVLLSSGTGTTVNYDVRLLGRRGVMSVSLVCEPSQMDDALPEFRKLLATHTFVAGEKYSEYREGDKVAAYGLGALVTGGVIAAAAKSGLLQKLWKFIVAGVLAGFAALKRMFGGGDSKPRRPVGGAGPTAE